MKGESESNVSLDTGGEGVAQGSGLTKGRDTRRYVSFVGKLVTFVRIIQAIGRILPSMELSPSHFDRKCDPDEGVFWASAKPCDS